MKKKKDLERIVFTGDFDRPNPQAQNINFFYNLLKLQLNMCGVPLEVIDRPKRYLNLSEWLERESGEVWYGGDDFNRSTLVIGFEMSRAHVRSLKARDIPFIAFDISPIRFMNDLCIRISDCSPDINLDMKFELGLIQIEFAANLMKAAKAYDTGIAANPGSVLVIGQTPHDRTVIYGGRFHSISEYVEDTLQLADGKRIYYKPHPYHNNSTDMCRMLSAQNCEQINIYKLLSQNEFTDVIGLSSSVLSEAVFFDKKVHRFLPEAKNLMTVSARDFMSVSLWQSMLAEFISGDDDFCLEYHPGMLRVALKTYWGYDLYGKGR